MKYDHIKDLISFVLETDIQSINIKTEDGSIQFDRGFKSEIENVKNINYESNNKKNINIEKNAELNKLKIKENTNGISETSETNGIEMLSPIVGTFYESSSPGEKPFVKVGEKVKKGDTLFIIEAMKVINEIEAPCDGIISEIFVKDGELLEFNQKILKIL